MPLPPRLSSLCRNLFHKARKEQVPTEEMEAYGSPFYGAGRKWAATKKK